MVPNIFQRKRRERKRQNAYSKPGVVSKGRKARQKSFDAYEKLDAPTKRMMGDPLENAAGAESRAMRGAVRRRNARAFFKKLSRKFRGH